MNVPAARRRPALGAIAAVLVLSILALGLLIQQWTTVPFPSPTPVGVDPYLGRRSPTPSPPVAPAGIDAIHVAADAAPGGDGTSAHPFTSIKHAAETAPAGATIVVSGGEYHETVQIDTPNLTVRAADSATVWLDGSVPAGTVEPNGETWRLPGQAPELDRSPTYRRGAPDGTREGWRFVPPERPLAADPSQIWRDGVPLRQVAPASAVSADTFAVEDGDVILGQDPSGHDIRIGTLPHGLIIHGPGTRVEGIGVRRYVPSVPDFGAVIVDGRGALLRGVAVVDSSTTGVSIQQEEVTLDNVQVAGSGMLGIQAHRAYGLRIDGGVVGDNNLRGFNVAPNAGGFKITETANITLRGLTVQRNQGVGLWLDESVADATLTGLRAQGNSSHGVLIELSTRARMANSRLLDNGGSGLRVQNSDAISVWNVTSAGNHRAVDFVQDGRIAGAASAPKPAEDSRIPPMTWRIGDSSITNSILGPSHGDAVLAVEDFSTALDADAIGIHLNSNVYRRYSDRGAKWTHVWSRPNDDPRVYEHLAGFARHHPADRTSTEQSDTSVSPTPQPAPPPVEVLHWSQLPSNPGIGAAGANDW